MLKLIKNYLRIINFFIFLRKLEMRTIKKIIIFNDKEKKQ